MPGDGILGIMFIGVVACQDVDVFLPFCSRPCPQCTSSIEELRFGWCLFALVPSRNLVVLPFAAYGHIRRQVFVPFSGLLADPSPWLLLSEKPTAGFVRGSMSRISHSQMLRGRAYVALFACALRWRCTCSRLLHCFRECSFSDSFNFDISAVNGWR